MELNQYDGGGGGSQQANKRPRSEDEDLLPSSHHQFKFNSTANLFNFECQTFEAIIADTSLDSPEKIQMATKGLILTLVQEAELLLKDAFKGASLGRPNPTANVPIPSTSFASVVAEKDKPVKPAPPKAKAKSTFVNLAPSFESHVVVRVDGEVRDDEICESFRSNHSVQSLLENREIRVVHRSNNAAHSTTTVFIEVDNQVAEILGQHGRIPVAGLVHRPLRVLQVNAKKSPTVILEIANLANSTQADIVLLQELSTNFFWPTRGFQAFFFVPGAYIPSGIVARSNLHPIPLTSPDTAITTIAICLEQSIIVVHSAYWHGLRAADDFIPLLEDTIRRTSLPVILGMDTNAHSPTWGIGARLDFRGANLEEFASFNDFHFLGPPVDSTWSNGPLSSSIDVTLASSSLAIHVTRGLLDEMAFTDHIPIWTTFLDMVNNETKSSWVESSCKEQTFKSFLNSSLHQEIGGEGFDDFGEHDIEELLVDEALNDDDILESMVDTTKDFETVDSELEDVTPLDEKLLREGLQLSGVLDRLRFLPIKKMDQRTCIKFCVKNEIKCVDAFRMLTVAYGEATLDRSNVYRCYKMFSEGREDVNDEERAGRPITSTTDEKINEVEKMILANRRITVREVAEDLNISIGLCHSNFINDLGMRRVAAKFVPKLLNCDQKQHRMNIANEMLDSVRDGPNLLQRVITGDEAWVYGYDVETKAQSSQWKLPHEPRPKKARQVRWNVKVLLTVFFDCRGVVHHEFLPQGRTVNKEYYLQVMRNLRGAIRQKRPDLWKNKNWLLHHDNAPAHTSLLVRDVLAKNNTLMMPQPPYSPDLAPCDFLLFPKLKRPMKGRRYATLDEIKTASKEELKKIF
ncbi:hypothetical protein LAZ67_22002308 [Cordylochernes scorpioides]|uniref:Endonuclease/exonuclease/phosphatase domain-containing protein n=1 Tax=Cordylochernes scorpioides TaxID=51811 RepID=A0ABY6LRX5_9ARAC|nr:hypothetical protein LAZ67_22002308 [Cordylochernes scorpioides]